MRGMSQEEVGGREGARVEGLSSDSPRWLKVFSLETEQEASTPCSSVPGGAGAGLARQPLSDAENSEETTDLSEPCL